MPSPLTPEQCGLAKQIVLRHGANSELLAALARDELTDAERVALGDLEELAASGFDADYEPTTGATSSRISSML